MGTKATAGQAEQEQRASIRAARSMFGCGNGGIIFDESMDPTEMVSALTEEERQQIRLGECHGCPLETMIAEEDGNRLH